MGRSLGFGSTTAYSTPYSDSLSLRLHLFGLTLHDIVTRRSILQKVRHHPLTGSDYLLAHGFRCCFTPLPGFFSPFPHGTGSLSVTREYLGLGDGPPGFRRNFSCSAVLRIPARQGSMSHTGLSPCLAQLSSCFCYRLLSISPVLQPQNASILVWPLPVSLAATRGIAFAFSSCRYLDVSVPHVYLVYSYVFTINISLDEK